MRLSPLGLLSTRLAANADKVGRAEDEQKERNGDFAVQGSRPFGWRCQERHGQGEEHGSDAAKLGCIYARGEEVCLTE